MNMNSEREGQNFGKTCWKEGKTVEETLSLAAKECGLDKLPGNEAKWPKFVHGAEEAWQDLNLELAEE
jgi:hypothetical protein